MENTKSEQITLTPEHFVDIFLASPEICREGLKRLQCVHPDFFSQYVPQAIDKQTGLLTKDYFENNTLPLAIVEAEASNIPLSYLLVDIDNFHDFNETYGHIKGHEAIAKFTDLMKKTFRTKNRRTGQAMIQDNSRSLSDRRKQKTLDQLVRIPKYIEQARVGCGEEFGILLYDCNEQLAELIADRFLDKVRDLRIPYGRDETIGLTISGGVSQYKIGTTKEQLMEWADRALFYSKDQGKDRSTRFSVVPPDFVPKQRKRN